MTLITTTFYFLGSPLLLLVGLYLFTPVLALPCCLMGLEPNKIMLGPLLQFLFCSLLVVPFLFFLGFAFNLFLESCWIPMSSDLFCLFFNLN